MEQQIGAIRQKITNAINANLCRTQIIVNSLQQGKTMQEAEQAAAKAGYPQFITYDMLQ